MAIADKYELVTPSDVNPARAIHRRLRREVVVHAVDLKRMDTEQAKRVRDIGTNLARLDHPAIPQLLDFIAESDSYFLAFESFPQPLQLDELPRFEALCQLERLCDALAYAAALGVQHCDLKLADLRVDSQGHLKIVGLGLKQLWLLDGADGAGADLQQITRWTQATLERDRDAAFTEVETLLAKVRQGKCSKLADFRLSLRHWLDREMARREAEKLTFAEADPEDVALQAGRSMTPRVLIAIGVACFLLMGLLAVAFWPSSARVATLSPVAEEKTPVVAAADVVPDGGKPNREAAFISELANVGVLNNSRTASAETDAASLVDAAVVPVLDSEESHDPNRSVTGRDEGESETKSDFEAATSDVEKTMESEAEGSLGDTPRVVTGAEAGGVGDGVGRRRLAAGGGGFTKVRSAAGDSGATFVTLPEMAEKQRMSLVEVELPAPASLELQLIGGAGCLKQGEFKLSGAGDNRWLVSFEDSESRPVAAIEYVEGHLQFAWTTSKESQSIAAYLCNVALQLSLGAFQHTVALRDFERRAAIPVELERRKPYELDIPWTPTPDDVVVEFVPVDGSLAAALPRSIINADEMMRIGLDAGKHSLVVLEIEPKFRTRKQSLAVRAIARATAESRFVPVKPGAGATLGAELAGLTQGLFRMKAAKGKAKGNAKKRMETQIRVMENNKRQLEAFAESYLAAKQTKLQFRIYRQVGPHRIPLVAFED